MCDRISFQPVPVPEVSSVKYHAPTTAKGPYIPKKRDLVICPVCQKQFSVNASEHRYRVKKFKKEPCCSRKCGAVQRHQTNGGK
jgi:hypothetical protein